MLKASMGGGGKGMRLVQSENDIEAAFRMATSEAQNAFGDSSVYLEKYIENPHHVEVQVLGDKYGNVIHLFERECSIQRRHQKVCTNAVRKLGYYSAGTFEMIVDKNQNFYFLEMNTRLQVEHAITESVTGVNIVWEMIKIANGDTLTYKQEEIKRHGCAIECRIYAEDPDNNFLPSPGLISVYESPEGRNVRVDGGAHKGYEVSLYYDPMIAKLITWGINRNMAIKNMHRALNDYKILGIKTTIPFHIRVINNKTFIEGNYDTTFIDKKFSLEDLKRKQLEDPTVAIVAAAVKQYLSERKAAARATTRPDVGESVWRYHGRLKNLGNSL